MKVKGHTLGAWFNHKRFNQRKAKSYTLSKRFDHRLSRWLSKLLFKLLPPRWYLRTQGIKVHIKPVVAIVTYLRPPGYDDLLSNKRQALIRFINAEAVVEMIPLWFEHGFVEPPSRFDEPRYRIPPSNILKVEWYDPILEDDVSIRGPSWRLDGNDSDSPD